jgi:hypothetical protein
MMSFREPQAWQAALTQRTQPSIINVHLARDDASPAMRRLAEHLGRQVSGGS